MKRVEAKELSHLLDEHGQSLTLFASQWTSSPEDCVQDAFVKLAAQSVRPDNPAAWLFKVVRHRAINLSRSNQRRKAREEKFARSANDSLDPAKSLEKADEQAFLLKTLETLPGELRELVVLRIWSGLNWNQIAEIAGTSSSSACRSYNRALQLVKARMVNTTSENKNG